MEISEGILEYVAKAIPGKTARETLGEVPLGYY